MLKLKPLLSQLSIQTKSLDVRKLDLDYVDPVDGDFSWAQREFVDEVERQYNTGKPVRIITLKARQLGISTVTEGIFFWWTFLHPGSNELVVTHETASSTELFGKTKLYWETWPFRNCYNLKYATKQNLEWTETRSKLRIATAKNVQTGRGATMHAVHLSECAFYPDPETLMGGLNQTIPTRHGTIVVLESTANGVGNWFYDEWQKAEEGSSDYVPLFFPWYKHPEYKLLTTLTIKSELSAEEKALLQLGATYENLAWRRWAIINKAGGDIDLFMQEYPSTPEEAFMTTGTPIFSHQHLKEAFKEIRPYRGRLIDRADGSVQFYPDAKGPVTIFKQPKPGRSDRYFVSGDPSESIGGDPSCAQVINRQTFEQVAVYHDRVNPMFFADEMMKLGKYYNYCMLCPEVEGGGQATIATIIAKGYNNIWMDKRPDHMKGSFNVYGWATNWQRKSWAIGTLQKLVMDGSIIIHDRITYNQLRNYVMLDNGEMGPAGINEHDDGVMALAIAVTASLAEGPFVADIGMQPDTIMDIYNQGVNA